VLAFVGEPHRRNVINLLFRQQFLNYFFIDEKPISISTGQSFTGNLKTNSTLIVIGPENEN
jgi:hypothetical protein